MILAWIGAVAIGLSLGLLGSGGSILTVPVLTFLVGQEEKTAITGSLFVVGTVALVGGLVYAWRRSVDWRSVVFFGLPGMLGTTAGAWGARYVTGALQLSVFALVMLAAALLMFRPPWKAASLPRERPRSRWKVATDGIGVGLLTGFVGVGGGFLIVPALVLLGGLPMSLAVGTSLMIIAINAYTGFVRYLPTLDELGLSLDWPVLLGITALGVAGSLVGRKIGKRIPQEKLRRVFAGFLVVVGAWILWRTLPRVVG